MEENQASSTDLDTNEDKTSDGTEHNENVFPLLLLPVELILLILRFLPTADRWRARVCKKLYQIEEGARFPAKSVAYSDIDNSNIITSNYEIKLNVHWEESWEAVATLQKIGRNMDLREVYVQTDSHQEKLLLPLIRGIRADTVTFESWDYAMDGKPELTADETFDEWTRERKHLLVIGFFAFSGEVLFQAFTDMASGRSSLQQLAFLGNQGPRPEATRKLLKLMGISWHQETGFTSTRRDIQMFELRDSVSLEEDTYDQWGDLLATPTRHLLILIGWTMKVTVRKWVATEKPGPPPDADPNYLYYHENETTIEKFDEDGAKPEFDPVFGLTIADIRSDRDTYSRVPLTYLQ